MPQNSMLCSHWHAGRRHSSLFYATADIFSLTPFQSAMFPKYYSYLWEFYISGFKSFGFYSLLLKKWGFDIRKTSGWLKKELKTNNSYSNTHYSCFCITTDRNQVYREQEGDQAHGMKGCLSNGATSSQEESYHWSCLFHLPMGCWELSHNVCCIGIHLGIIPPGKKRLKYVMYHSILGHSRFYSQNLIFTLSLPIA